MISSQVLTSIAAHAKLIAVGTQMGYIWIMDHFGHVDNQNVPVMRPHRSAVTRLAIDEPGNYVISCANDGRVAISGIGCNNLNHVVTLSVMPRSIAISPSFSLSTSTPMFAIGERNFVLYEKKFFQNYKELVSCFYELNFVFLAPKGWRRFDHFWACEEQAPTIFRGGEQDGFITQCTWRQFILIRFTCDKGTRVFDRLSFRLISLIPPSHDVDRMRSSRFPPSHCWLSDNQLAIAWADTVTIVMIVSTEGSLVRQAEIHFTWHIDMFCSGVSYLADSAGDWKEIVVFGLKNGLS
ncbi:hypothetical protein COOONC_22665 [Cooperia oncophora]